MSATTYPHNIEAERAVLGAILISPDEVLRAVAPTLLDVDFYLERHRRIYGRMLSFWRAGKAIDLVTLFESFRIEGIDAEIGGMTYLAGLTEAATITPHVLDHAQIIARHAQMRDVLRTAEKVLETIREPGILSHEAAMLACQQEMSRATSRRIGPLPEPERRSISDHVQAMWAAVYDLAAGRSAPALKTGFADLDRMIGGLKDGRLYVLGGRPAMGKSAKAQRICFNVAHSAQVPCLYLSTEMSEDEVAERWVSQHGRVDVVRLERNEGSEEEWGRFDAAAELVGRLPLTVRYVAGPKLFDLVETVEAWLKEVGGYGVVCLDYLQHVQVPRHSQNRHAEVGEVSRTLKRLAGGGEGRRRIPILAVTQLNRAVEARTEKRPTMSDLRESGDIEQDADVILLMYREAYYQHQRQGVREVDLPDEIRRRAEVIVAKQRRGSVGIIRERWFGEWTLFADAADDWR